jgi:hypothetical protein
MRKIFTLLLVAGCIGATSAAADTTSTQTTSTTTTPTTTTVPNASQQCRTLRTQMGVALFKTTYGTNKNKANAFGKCVSQMSKKQSSTEDKAESQCRTEEKADPAAFKAKYGTNKNKSNAFGKCVSSVASKSSQTLTTATVNAAKQCKAERAADAAAFKAKYGTNKNKSNAFGKCVSKLASAKS